MINPISDSDVNPRKRYLFKMRTYITSDVREDEPFLTKGEGGKYFGEKYHRTRFLGFRVVRNKR